MGSVELSGGVMGWLRARLLFAIVIAANNLCHARSGEVLCICMADGVRLPYTVK